MYLLLLASLLFRAQFGAAQAADPPNIIIIFADDLGYGDLSVYGHPTIRTPQLDRMAAEGLRFTQFYVGAAVCTPSRAALLTGRLPQRSGLGGQVLFPYSAGGLPDSEITIAEALKTRGYSTMAIGKWHLGHLPEHLPTTQGFDHYFGIPYSNDMGSAQRGDPPLPLLRDTTVVESPVDQTTLTRRYTEEALRFIREHRRGPFFLYFAHTFPHVPLYASDSFRGKSPRGIYGDAVEELDWSVGRVLQVLRETGLDRNTLVFFTSDNGPWLTQLERGGSAGLLREGKGSTWEGGMREPAIAWWPRRIEAGRVTTALGTTMDLFPTLLTLAGANVPSDRVLDGVDLAPLLFGRAETVRDFVYYYRGNRMFAIRQGPWKLHFLTQDGYGQPQPVEHDPPLLFNLEEDPSEKYDVAGKHPDVIARLREEAERHRANLNPAPSQFEKRIPGK